MKHLKMLASFLVLLVLTQTSWAHVGEETDVIDKDAETKCKAFHDGAVEEVAPLVSKSEKPLHKAGEKLIKDMVCSGGSKCLKRNGERLTKVAHTVVDICLSEPGIPINLCLGFVAAVSNEGGGLEHPTCGGLRQKCVRKCDEFWDNNVRHDCFIQCAIDQGIPRSKKKNSKWQRIWRCNDKGTSRGPLQMKRLRIRQCRSLKWGNMGADFDPFKLEDAVLCLMRVVRKVATSKRWACGRVQNRWLVAFKRVTRGVIRTVAKATPGQWVPDAHGGRKWIEPQKRRVEQICSESGYGNRGLRYYKACGKKCRQVERYNQAPTPVIGKGDKVSLQSP